MNDLSSDAYSDSASAQLASDELVMTIYIVTAIVSLIAYVIGAVLLGMIFKKANVPAWKAWVPVYNNWTFLELGGQRGWLALLSLTIIIPIVGLITLLVLAIYQIIAAYKIGKKFGKEDWFVALYILLPIVWLVWLAVDKSAVWQESEAAQVPPATFNPIAAPTESNTTPETPAAPLGQEPPAQPPATDSTQPPQQPGSSV